VPYLIVEDFKAGLDLRRSIVTADSGSLQVALNVHITRGGEVEKRKAFVNDATLPAGTFGLARQGQSRVVFGSADLAASMPSGYIYQRLQHPSAIPMTGLIGWALFNGKVYAIASYTDGRRLHFYDGTIVPAWAPGGTYQDYLATGVRTNVGKVYVVANASLVFCAVNDATNWSGTGSGVIDMSNQAEGSEVLTGLDIYQNRLAIYARRHTQIWSVDLDPALNAVSQQLPNTGTFAANSLVAFGNSDNFFLGDTGVRSLRARDSSNQAGVFDIGTPIDDAVTGLLATLTEAQRTQANGVLDPVDGRYLLAVGGTVYAFSFFSASKISAWTQYDLGGQVSDWLAVAPRLYARVGDQVLLYGGASGLEYDASPAELVLPYLSAKTPATTKEFTSFDSALTGQWTVEVGMNAESPDARELIARVHQPTFSNLRFGAQGQGTHFGLRLTNSTPGVAKVANVILHYVNVSAD
jgi:hypothetical protein